ncbi:MAG: DUF1552 domain-containing protein [Gemmataceae bacterium]|nr:DUF1552 domain-containing protein [Gemmataceae bacterium]MDW8266109.1 DUF1552 domain-containing protein [Gemmataceae bacterium]
MFEIISKKHLSRRAFLRGAGVALALPWLDAMTPALARGAEVATPPRRFMAFMYGLGFHAPFLFPKKAGPDYELTPYLEILKEHRRDFSIISGLSHAEQNGANGHSSSLTWLTSARHPGLPGFRNTISLDQLLVERLRPDTRFPYLALNVGGLDSLSWNAQGVNLPALNSPSQIFRQLFLEGTPAEVRRQLRDLQRGGSILDAVQGEAQRLAATLGGPDRERLDQYLTSVRQLENELQAAQAWVKRPRPKVAVAPPVDVADRYDIIARTRLMHDVMVLALQTDSTRIITYDAGGFNPVPRIPGVDTGWHDLSHHGQDPEKIQELSVIESAEFREINRLLGLLKGVREGDKTLLDHTVLLIGSNLGNASAHSWRDLPIILAGGGFRHGQHLVAGGRGFDNTRFANLFVHIARHLGVDIDRFGSSTATSIPGLESA